METAQAEAIGKVEECTFDWIGLVIWKVTSPIAGTGVVSVASPIKSEEAVTRSVDQDKVG